MSGSSSSLDDGSCPTLRLAVFDLDYTIWYGLYSVHTLASVIKCCFCSDKPLLQIMTVADILSCHFLSFNYDRQPEMYQLTGGAPKLTPVDSKQNQKLSAKVLEEARTIKEGYILTSGHSPIRVFPGAYVYERTKKFIVGKKVLPFTLLMLNYFS